MSTLMAQISANANKYSWVWKKSSVKNREKIFVKITTLLQEMNQSILSFGIKFGIREEYAIEYLEQILEQYVSLMGIRPENIAEHIKICGKDRNSCSKTDHDATFWHL